MSPDLARKIELNLEELATIREQFNELLLIPPGAAVGVIETAAASAMLHSFYTENRKEFSSSLPRNGMATCPRPIHGTRSY